MNTYYEQPDILEIECALGERTASVDFRLLEYTSPNPDWEHPNLGLNEAEYQKYLDTRPNKEPIRQRSNELKKLQDTIRGTKCMVLTTNKKEPLINGNQCLSRQEHCLLTELLIQIRAILKNEVTYNNEQLEDAVYLPESNKLTKITKNKYGFPGETEKQYKQRLIKHLKNENIQWQKKIDYWTEIIEELNKADLIILIKYKIAILEPIK